MKANRTMTREKAMTVLYQIFLYKKNNNSFNWNNYGIYKPLREHFLFFF